MCGIAGALKAEDAKRLEERVFKMLDRQRHRGPDDLGITIVDVAGGALALGNLRLAIIDLSPLGHQPMFDPETSSVLVYNGELYNAPELRSELAATGHVFLGGSDTEVVLHALREYGTGAFSKFVGMFALAWWDARGGRLVLARDHLGIKPLYVAELPSGGLAFASEVRAILSSGLVPRKVDRRGLASFFAYGAVQEPLTIVEGVRAVPRGSWMSFNASGRSVGSLRYWRAPAPDAAAAKIPEHEHVKRGRALLEQAVHRHCLSDVPVGVFLSSGLDSTAVAGFAARGGAAEAFTVTSPEHPGDDEGSVARQSARRFGIRHVERAVDEATAFLRMAAWLGAMDQPTIDGLNTLIVSRAVQEEGLKVALSGQGGDEIFGGYASFRSIGRWKKYAAFASLIPSGLRGRLVRLALRNRPYVVREKGADLACAGTDIVGLYHHSRRLVCDSDMARLGFDHKLLGLAASFHEPGSDGHDLVIAGDPIATVSRLETEYYLGNTLLRDGDVFGMACSLEIRVPLLDRDLVEWAYGLPGRVLLPAGSRPKHLLRAMASDLYSPEQLDVPKRGFTLPYAAWLLGPSRTMMEQTLDVVLRSGLVEPMGVTDLRDRFLAEPRSAAWARVWALVALGAWLEKNGFTGAS